MIQTPSTYVITLILYQGKGGGVILVQVQTIPADFTGALALEVRIPRNLFGGFELRTLLIKE